jgi:hypothetical protein
MLPFSFFYYAVKYIVELIYFRRHVVSRRISIIDGVLLSSIVF